MIRKQIYITEEQDEALALQAEETNRSQSELIREAIDHILAERERHRRSATLRATAGLWSDRTDLPDWETLRREGDDRLEIVTTRTGNAT
jgi:Arc/MetJ-type ribon-helix-helix transcriptional regulator